jgi:hypothetical protein
MPAANPRIAVIQLVGKAGLILGDHIADRVFRNEAESLLAARPRANAALHRLLLMGYLEARPVAIELTDASSLSDVSRTAGGVAFDQGFTLTQKAALEFNLPLPPTLREPFVTHHVKTLEAIWKVERDLRLRGADLVSWKTESELIRESFRGKKFGSDDVIVPKFPDAQILVRASGSSTEPEAINIEYVSSKYTNEMIQEKARAFAGTRTIWAVPGNSPGTAARVERITGMEALPV